jgi:hypothetical protein
LLLLRAAPVATGWLEPESLSRHLPSKICKQPPIKIERRTCCTCGEGEGEGEGEAKEEKNRLERREKLPPRSSAKKGGRGRLDRPPARGGKKFRLVRAPTRTVLSSTGILQQPIKKERRRRRETLPPRSCDMGERRPSVSGSAPEASKKFDV